MSDQDRELRAKDLMRTDVFTVREDDRVDDLLESLLGKHIHGAPVLGADGNLVGMVTQQDVFFSAMTRSGRGGTAALPARVGSIMTSPAVSASEGTGVVSLCRMMHRLRIHHVPIVNDGKVTGIIGSLDICGAVSQKQLG
jgi:CBS domain-containing protein